MEILQFTTDLDENVARLNALFAQDKTFIVRRLRAPEGLRCAVFFFDGMIDNQAINQSIVRPLLRAGLKSASAEALAESVLQINECRVETDLHAMLTALLYGDTVVLTEGDSRPIVLNSKGFDVRAGDEPDNERVLRGPREGFTESFMTNLSMLRRRVNDPRLTFTFSRYAAHTHTAVCLCWIKGVTDPALVREMQKRLDALTLDGILDANYIAECIRDDGGSPFPTLGTTERPDVAVARMLEGRVAIVVDGTPVVLTAPCILQECFQANDDYYISVRQAALARVLRVAGFLLSITIPGLYIALLHFHQELLPTRLLLAIAAARTGMPLPPFWEIFLLLIVFEVLKEAGARTPGVMGSTMSIVGGLVLGQSAVSARFLSAPAVIIVAVAAVTALTVPKLQSAGMVLRFLLLAAGAAAGLYGLTLGLALTLGHLCTLRSAGTPYLLNLAPRVETHDEDVYTRAPWRRMRRRRFLARKEGGAS
ncbi:MAG: spore germination protein [Clostridiales bacterium]|nr:spore germination protein [Clostridiales bacterium]